MGSIKKFYSRSELGMRAPKSVSKNVTPERGGVALHYGGGSQKITSQKQARERWLSWQKMHMDGHGWVDIAYTAGYDNWGNVYAGRGFGVRTAANGTNSSNQNYLAFVWLGGGNEKPSAAALDALNWLIEEARKHGAGDDVKPHKHFKATGCPGSFLTSHAKKLDGKSKLPDVDTGDQSEPPTPPKDPEPEPTRNYLAVGDKGSEVRAWQGDLRKWDRRALPRYGVDGHFGEETDEWTRRFQGAANITVDGKVGPQTLRAMKKALEKPTFKFRHTDLIRIGSKGSAVKEWQNALRSWRPNALPRFGADGDFGAETRQWTRRFQSATGIVVDGVVGPQTRRTMVRVLSR